MSVQAEQLAIGALRAYLLRTLPAKATSINAGRAAVLKAPRAGPYVVPASGELKLGATIGSEPTSSLTAGSRTTAQVVAELSLVGLTASADAQDRLTITSTTAPSGSTQSIVSLGVDATGTNAAFGWDAGGESVVRAAIVAPLNRGVSDGEPDGVFDLGPQFWILIGERRTEPRSPNIRDDTHVTVARLEILASEPNGSTSASHEYIQQCVRAVREALLDDRTLDAQVLLTEIPRVQYEARTFRFQTAGGAAPLMSAAQLDVRIKVFERS